jgi:transposase InsO family protein
MGDDTKLSITKLAGDGSNWVTYRDRMTWAIDSRGWQDHLLHDSITPAYQTAGVIGGLDPAVRWQLDEATVKQLIAASVPDTAFNQIKTQTNAKDVWSELRKLFEARTKVLLMELGRKIHSIRCEEDENICLHFDRLADLRQQLASMGKSITDEEYASILLGSLPDSYEGVINAIAAAADISGNDVTAATVTRLAQDEHNRRIVKRGNDPVDESFAVSAQKPKNKKRDIECFNCKKRGHIKADCWAKGGGKEGQGPRNRGSNASATTAEEQSQDFEAWVTVDDDDDLTVVDPGDENEAADLEDEIEYVWTVFEEEDDEPMAMLIDSRTPIKTELYDSGASRHMSPFRDKFISYRSIEPRAIKTADKRLFYAIGAGDLQVDVPNGATTSSVLLRDALHAPDIGVTIVSVSQIAEAGNTVSFAGDFCEIKNQKGDIIGCIPKNTNGLYRVQHDELNAAEVLERVTLPTLHRRLGHTSADSIRSLIRHHAVEGVELIEDSSPFYCESCEHAKTTRKPIKSERTGGQASAFGEEIHSDLWGPSRTTTLSRCPYYVTFTDDFSRFTVIETLKKKSDTLTAYKAYANWAQTQHGVAIKRLRSDRGGEFTGNEFTKFLQEQGTERRLTTHDTPQHNGVAEALNRRLMERVHAMLHQSGLPEYLWGEAVQHAVWLKNRSSTRVLGDVTPLERLTGIKPNIAGVPEWGQPVWVHISKGSKLQARGVKARWVGYDRESPHAHRIYWPEQSKISIERDVKLISDTATVYAPSQLQPGQAASVPPQQIMAPPPTPPAQPAPTPQVSPLLRPTMPKPVTAPPSPSTPGAEDAPQPSIPPSPLTPLSTTTSMPSVAPPPAPRKGKTKISALPPEPPKLPTRKSSRMVKPSDYIKRLIAGEGTAEGSIPPSALRWMHPNFQEAYERHTSSADQSFDTAGDEDSSAIATEFVFSVLESAATAAVFETEGNPKTLHEAQARPDWPLWKEAMDHEIATLEQAGTWETVPRPQGKNIVSSKWVFRIKRKADGTIEKYKARLVARGFTQVYGIDYFDTYSPVAKLASIRTILAFTARYDWDIETFDFIGAYLNGELGDDEDIYMQAPPGYEHEDEHVKHLKKSLYGLKQAGRRWYDTLSSALTKIGFRVSKADPGVFYLRAQCDILILAVHVDDCVLTGSSSQLIVDYKKKINAQYSLTDLGPIHWLLGIKITRDRFARTISLSQEAYLNTIITRFNLSDAKPQRTPMVANATYSKQDDLTDATTMSDVPYREAIGSLMYAAVATRPDIAFVVSMLSQFLENPSQLHWQAVKRIFRYLIGTKSSQLTYGTEYHDLAGFTDADGASQPHRHAISGYAFMIDGGAISWRSRKQELVTLSTAEAEYVAATHAAKEAIWLRHLISEIIPPVLAPTTLYCDNQAAIKLITNDNYHARTKHIDIRYHFIRQVISTGSIKMTYCPTEDMTADIFTKALPYWKVKMHCLGLGLHRAPVALEGDCCNIDYGGRDLDSDRATDPIDQPRHERADTDHENDASIA